MSRSPAKVCSLNHRTFLSHVLSPRCFQGAPPLHRAGPYKKSSGEAGNARGKGSEGAGGRDRLLKEASSFTVPKEELSSWLWEGSKRKGRSYRVTRLPCAESVLQRGW